MSLLLQITLIAVLVAVAAGVVPLLFQMRRTAQAMEAFLASSRQDLAQIAQDVHAARLRLEGLADSLQDSLDELSVFARSLGEVGRSVKDFHARMQRTIDCASRGWGGISGGISTVLAFFKSKLNPSKPESENCL